MTHPVQPVVPAIVSPLLVLLSTLHAVFGGQSPAHAIRRKDNDASTEALAILRSAHVLLVEDNEINQKLALELLVSNGLSVEVANNGQEAQDMLKKLRTLLEESDPEAADLAEKLELSISTTKNTILAGHLIKAIEDSEFDEALKVLDKLQSV